MKSRWVLVACLSVAVVAPFSGCRSAAFSKPDFSKLAFWKKEDRVAALPPPPARHFDPLEVEIEDPGQELAERSDAVESPANPGLGLEPRFDAGVQPSGGQEDVKPLRSPYSFEGGDGGSGGENTFDLNTKRIQSEFGAAGNADQQRFRDAMASAESSDLGGGAFEGFGAPLADAARDTQQQLQRFANQTLDQGTQLVQDQQQQFSQRLDQTAQNLSQGLGRLEANAQNQVNEYAARAQDAVQSLNPLQPLPTPGSTGSSSAANDPLQAQMEAARQEIQHLRQKVAQQQAGGSSPAPRTGPLTELPGAASPDANATFAPPTSFQPQSTPAPSGYPSTPHNEFTKAPDNPGFGGSFEGLPVGFQGEADGPGDSSVTRADAQLPLQPMDVPHQAAAIPNHVDVAEVPEAVLIGEGSYAPGSLTTLQQR